MYNPCQFSKTKPCANRGDVCLKTTEEKIEYNKYIDEFCPHLREIKFQVEAQEKQEFEF